MPKSQELIKQQIQTRMNNTGFYVVEHEIDFEGSTIISYLIMPQNLSSKADEVSDYVFSPTVESEDFEDDTAADVEPKAGKKPIAPKKKVTKPVKKTTKK